MKTARTGFAGMYYDGKSANAWPVRLFLQPTQMEMVFSDGHRVAWSYSAVKLSRAGSRGPIRMERKTVQNDSLPEALVIENPDFLQAAHEVAPNALGNLWNRPHQRRLRYLLLILALVIIPPFLFSLWVYGIPATTDYIAEHVPPEWEENLGQNYVHNLFKEPLKEPDEKTRKALDIITERLLKTVPNQPYHFHVYVHPADVVNAFALPGGTIVIFQGLINASETPEELAGVLAHEFQHVLKRHSTRAIIRSEAIHFLLLIVSGNSDSMTNVILEAGSVLEFLRFSRALETEADAEGMKMMLAAGVDPQGMVRMYEKLEKAHASESEEDDEKDPEKETPAKNSGGEPSGELDSEEDEDSLLPEWMKYLSTHPATQERVEKLKTMAEQSNQPVRPLLPDVDWKTLHRKATKQEGFSL